jgi:translation elongation factor EF-G
LAFGNLRERTTQLCRESHFALMEIDAMDIDPTRRLASAWRGDSGPARVNGERSWLIEIPIEPKSKDDRDRLVGVLAELAADDPAFSFSVRSEFGPIVLRGMAELQHDIKISRLRVAKRSSGVRRLTMCTRSTAASLAVMPA